MPKAAGAASPKKRKAATPRVMQEPQPAAESAPPSDDRNLQDIIDKGYTPWVITKPIPYARNPRKNLAGVATVKSSIVEYGWQKEILVDEHDVILSGHTRLMAALELGLHHVPVRVQRGWTEAKKRAWRIMDNKSGEKSEWERDLLKAEVFEIELAGHDPLMTGFDAVELAGMRGVADFAPGTADKQATLDEKAPVTCPKCHHQFQA